MTHEERDEVNAWALAAFGPWQRWAALGSAGQRWAALGSAGQRWAALPSAAQRYLRYVDSGTDPCFVFGHFKDFII